MGYAGYVPAKLPPSRPTPAQAALSEVNSLESLETVGKLLKNTVLSPKEEKFRRIRLTNPKIYSLIVEAGALTALQQLGWSIDPADDSYLVLPRSKYMRMAEVRMVEDAKDLLKKRMHDAKRSKDTAARVVASPEAARIRAQLEADRVARAGKASA